MGRKYDFKYLVIGSGPAGTAAALTLAKAKKKVGLIEGNAFGGANLNTRDVPYGVTLNFAHTLYKMLHLPEFNNQDFSYGFPSIMAHQMKAVVELGGGNNSKRYEDSGLIVIRGMANFLDEHTVAVGERKFSAEYFILATGAKVDTAGIDGTEVVNFLPPEKALRLRRLPEAVMVVGGGSTGCEIAEYYATLGAKTILTEKNTRLLPREETEASQVIYDHLVNNLGVMVLTGAKVKALAQDEISKYVVFESDGEEKMVRVETIVLATGSRPNLDCGVENTGVKVSKNGRLKVDRYFQTSAKHVFAIGDVIGGESSTERAEYEGRLLANNLAGRTKSLANYLGFARVTNTMPGVVSYETSKMPKKHQKQGGRKAIVYLKDLPASRVYNNQAGFVKLVSDHSGHIIGGCVVAENAPAFASEVGLAIRHRLTALELASTPHPANEYSYAIQQAAKKLVR